MRTVHLTCFDAFGALRENPTRSLVSALAAPPGWRAVKHVLPTSYSGVGGGIDRIFAHRPGAVIMFGYTSKTDRLRLEHVARNRDGSPRRDNDGRLGSPVVRPGGPTAYPSTVDLMPMLSALHARRLPFTYSVDAGGYVCNHGYYLALEHAWAARPPVPCLFVHIPLGRTSAQRTEIRRGSDVVLACILGARSSGARSNTWSPGAAVASPHGTPRRRPERPSQAAAGRTRQYLDV